MRVQRFEDRGHRGCCGDGFRSALGLEQAIFRREPLGLLQGTLQFNLRTQNRQQVCSFSHRFWMKSRASRHMASTASSTLPMRSWQ